MKTKLLIIGLLVSFFGSAQKSSTPAEPVLLYSLPKTELVIEVNAERVNQKPGDFYQYSERFLATNDVVTSEKIFYRIKNITVSQRTVADPNRTYKIMPAKNAIQSLITVNEKGILCGLNLQVVKEKPNKPKELKLTEKKTESLLPLGEEYMLAGSVAKMAEGAAKQIYRIRESRAALLTGDTDHLPGDGSSFKYMLDGMDSQEKQLTELFTGKNTVEPVTSTVLFSPDAEASKKVAFRFSALSGVVDKDDLSGSPYFISIEYKPVINSDIAKEKNSIDLYSVIPVTANVKLSDGNNVIFEEEIIIPQAGALMPIPVSVLNKDSKVSVSPVTGRLLSIQ